MANVTADDKICTTVYRQRQVLVVFRVAALACNRHRLDPFSRDQHDVEYSLTTLNGYETIELGSKDDLAIFVFDFARENEPVGFAHDTKEHSLR